jgi:hypothetical protein
MFAGENLDGPTFDVSKQYAFRTQDRSSGSLPLVTLQGLNPMFRMHPA